MSQPVGTLPQEIPGTSCPPFHTALVNGTRSSRKARAFVEVAFVAGVSVGRHRRNRTAVLVENTIERSRASAPLFPARKLTGRGLDVREGCYLCHSQMIAPCATEVENALGIYSLAAESTGMTTLPRGSNARRMWARVGGRYVRMRGCGPFCRSGNPVVPEAIMPNMRSFDTRIDADHGEDLLKTYRVGASPYTTSRLEQAASDFKVQADRMATMTRCLREVYPVLR